MLAKIQSGLQWFPEREIGYYPVTESPYDSEYWEKYVGYADTDRGRAISQARIDFVRQFHEGPVCDIGIGCGDFIEKRGQSPDPTTGFDINPVGIGWLTENGLYENPYENPIEAATFWDVAEHIHDHGPLFKNIMKFIFMSIPIFTGPEDILKSKHFRRDEHCWYWTDNGLRSYMADFGFVRLGRSDFEVVHGREAIASYAFARL